jgi:hypothetical protein
VGLPLGYEDLIDHDQLRDDPGWRCSVASWRPNDLIARRWQSTLLEPDLSREAPTRYHKISYDAATIEGLFVDLFLDAHAAQPAQITLDLDASDDASSASSPRSAGCSWPSGTGNRLRSPRTTPCPTTGL